VNEHLKENLLRILDKVLEYINKQDLKGLKVLSNETIHDATVYQDEYSIGMAVFIYSLSKIYDREVHYENYKGWDVFCLDCFRNLELAKKKLVENDLEGFAFLLKRDLSHLSKVDEKLKSYIQDVFLKAKLNKASRLYEHGLSLGRTAELLGVNKFELMDYVGKTYIADVKENFTLPASKRLKFARGLFT